MKTLRILEREILIRRQKGFFKKERQVSIFYGDLKCENHYEDITNPRLRVKFVETFKTRGKKELQAYIDKLGRTDTEKWMKEQLNKVLEG